MSPENIKKLQKQKLDKLVRYAVKNSPFYAKLYSHIDLKNYELEDLPIVNKQMLMENLDTLFTDKNLNKKELEEYLESPDDYYFKNKYVVMATGGTTGHKGIFVTGVSEWNNVISALVRTFIYFGIKPNLKIFKQKAALIAGDSPIHGSVRMGLGLENVKLVKFTKIEANKNIKEIVQKLNDLQPDILITYASSIKQLTNEQISGRLNIMPHTICSGSEILLQETRDQAKKVWSRDIFDVYAMTELMPAAIECPCHKGYHFNDDIAIMEVVDQDNKPTPKGQTGKKILITNLFNYTQPLIRYEVNDEITLANRKCDCGRNFTLIEKIGGKNDNILTFKNRKGEDILFNNLGFYTTFDKISEIQTFKVVKTVTNLKIYIEPTDKGNKEDIEKEIISKLTNRFAELDIDLPHIEVLFVEIMERNPISLKHRMIVDESI